MLHSEVDKSLEATALTVTRAESVEINIDKMTTSPQRTGNFANLAPVGLV